MLFLKVKFVENFKIVNHGDRVKGLSLGGDDFVLIFGGVIEQGNQVEILLGLFVSQTYIQCLPTIGM
jgi:hypothetical protein